MALVAAIGSTPIQRWSARLPESVGAEGESSSPPARPARPARRSASGQPQYRELGRAAGGLG